MVDNMLASLLLPTVHFGEVEVATDDIIEFVAPLPPFMAQRQYVLLADPAEEPFHWLQSVEQPALALVVAPYEAVMSQSPPSLSPTHRAELGMQDDEVPETYLVISLGASPAEATANVLAPLYICRRTRRARQIITGADAGLARVPLF